MTGLIQLEAPDELKSSEIQLSSGPVSYRCGADGTLWAAPSHLMELMSMGFWPTAHNNNGNNNGGGGSVDNAADYDPGDLTIAFQNNLI